MPASARAFLCSSENLSSSDVSVTSLFSSVLSDLPASKLASSSVSKFKFSFSSVLEISSAGSSESIENVIDTVSDEPSV